MGWEFINFMPVHADTLKIKTHTRTCTRTVPEKTLAAVFASYMCRVDRKD